MSTHSESSRVAVIGAGIAGAACAAGLAGAGFDVMLFDKSGRVGGRMATRLASWVGEDGRPRSTTFDHGAQHFNARRPRFRALVSRAEAAGAAAAWRPRVHTPFSSEGPPDRWVPVPDMPALCRHLLADLPLQVAPAVQRLQRDADGWRLIFADGSTTGSFGQVVMALPAAQAALLLAGHQDTWADSLAAVPMIPCWTLMAVTEDCDWPWDAAEPERGPLALVARNDRKPGRCAEPGLASWVAHATAAWSAAHLEEDPVAVRDALCVALARLLPGGRATPWHYVSVHRWRYAAHAAHAALGSADFWWDAALGLGVCGDAFGNGTVEAAWSSGDELADTVAAFSDIGLEGAAAGNEFVPTAAPRQLDPPSRASNSEPAH